MNTNENGLTADNSQPIKTLSKITIKFIAFCARIKSAASCFYLDRGIGLESIAMLILVAVFALRRVCK